jgi:GT2 family glycosyltransferase
VADRPWDPAIDVLVPTFNEERHIGRCLEALADQDYRGGKIRILVLDGGSTDRTTELAEAFAAGDGRVRVFRTENRRNLPRSLNLGLAKSTAELVAKIDGHGYIRPDFLRRAVEVFRTEGPEVACVGGRVEQMGETPFGEAVAAARVSRFGVGGSVYSSTKPREFVNSVQCGIYRREALVAVGGFDPDLQCGEDSEANWRLRQAGHRILLDASIRFAYVTRSSWRAAYRQYHNYGRARVKVLRTHPRSVRVRHLAPLGLLATAGLLAAAAPFSPKARRSVGGLAAVYLSLAAGSALKKAERPAIAWRMPAAYLALHLGYALGTLAELLAVAQGADPISRLTVPSRRRIGTPQKRTKPAKGS